MISIFTCTSEESFVVLSLIVVVVFDAVFFFFYGNGFEPSQLHVHVRH